MNLLIFFALPVATILLAIVLERILHSPFLVAITFFSIYLIILFILFATGVVTDLSTYLIAIIVYTVLAFITAVIVRFIRCICRRFLGDCCSICPRNNSDVEGIADTNCLCGGNNENVEENNNNNCNENNRFVVDGNVIPNNNRTGRVFGRYRRF